MKWTKYQYNGKSVTDVGYFSPLLFNIYSGYVFDKALQDKNVGIKINVSINNLRYADDNALSNHVIDWRRSFPPQNKYS